MKLSLPIICRLTDVELETQKAQGKITLNISLEKTLLVPLPLLPVDMLVWL